MNYGVGLPFSPTFPLVCAARASWVGWALVSLTVCKIASERMWQFESAPAHHTPSFWRGLRRVICIRNLVLGTGFSCFQSPGCQAPRRLQSCGKEAEKTVKTVGFFENRRYKISGPSAGFGAPTHAGWQ